MVVDADRGGAGRRATFGMRVERGERRGDPVPAGRPSIAPRLVERASRPPQCGLLDQQHPRRPTRRPPGRRRGRRRRRRRPARRHGVAAGRSCRGRARHGGDPEAGGAADHRLEDVLPGGARVDEGLVVEPGGQERAEAAADAPEVELEARPVVLAARDQAVAQLWSSRGRWARTRRRSAAGPTSAFGSSTPLATTPRGRWYLNDRPDQVHAVGEQRRGERVAGEPGAAPCRRS